MQVLGQRWSATVCSALLLLALLVIYLPGLGHGFIKDDFVWIAESEVTSVDTLVSLFTHAPDFYRPIVALSFALDRWLFGTDAFAYGVTNFVLLLCAAAALARLAVALGMSWGGALGAAALWSLNFHGIDMAVLWISGRTSLLLALFSILAAQAFVTGRGRRAAGLAFLAMLSKEEAVLLPFLLLVWGGLTAPDAREARGVRFNLRHGAARTWPLFLMLAVYMAVRTAAGAMTPMSAPDYYRFVLSIASLSRNALEYVDRAATLSVVTVILMSLIGRATPQLNRRQQQWVILGTVWMVVGYGLAVLLPVRSSLYAVAPSAGAALAGAALLTAVWDRTTPRLRSRMVVVGVLLTILTVPIHWSRYGEWVQWAELSTHVLDEIAPVADTLSSSDVIQIDDNRGERANLDSAFGTLIETAVLVRTGRHVNVWVEPPPVDWQLAGLIRHDPANIAARFALENGELVRLPVER
jgi:hypothetical protein